MKCFISRRVSLCCYQHSALHLFNRTMRTPHHTLPTHCTVQLAFRKRELKLGLQRMMKTHPLTAQCSWPSSCEESHCGRPTSGSSLPSRQGAAPLPGHRNPPSEHRHTNDHVSCVSKSCKWSRTLVRHRLAGGFLHTTGHGNNGQQRREGMTMCVIPCSS